jgi:hypothetical protein
VITVYDMACLKTVVKNTSGKTVFFAWVPPHGASLDNGDTVEIDGDILNAIGRSHRNAQRMVEAFISDLDNGYVAIVSKPNPILYDATAEDTVQIAVDDSTVNVEAPGYETYDT